MIKTMEMGMLLVVMVMQFVMCFTHMTWCSTSRDLLTGCILGDWICQCPSCMCQCIDYLVYITKEKKGRGH
jgi:hypothetical protein